MLTDFAKLNTFLMVVKEKSFSRASSKLGISQPAVTQQIKFIEDYLDAKIVERKKNGIRLTKEGESLLAVAQKIEKCIANAEKDILNIIDKNITFIFGASHIIGDYILPTFLNKIKSSINNDVRVNVDVSQNLIDDLKDKKIDMALIESPIFVDGIIYREWMEDEIVVFSNKQIPRLLSKEDLLSFDWICRDKNSHTRRVFKEAIEDMGIDCNSFNMISESTSPTTIVQTVLHSDSDSDKSTVSIVSKSAIELEIKTKSLYISKIKDYPMKRKLYIAYLKDRKHDAFIETVVNYLINVKKVN
jgi:DNA-binding transcriptional LysR family regulator